MKVNINSWHYKLNINMVGGIYSTMPSTKCGYMLLTIKHIVIVLFLVIMFFGVPYTLGSTVGEYLYRPLEDNTLLSILINMVIGWFIIILSMGIGILMVYIHEKAKNLENRKCKEDVTYVEENKHEDI